MSISYKLTAANHCPGCGEYFETEYCTECGYFPFPEKNFNKRMTDNG